MAVMFQRWVYRNRNSIVGVCNSDSSQFIDCSWYVIWVLCRRGGVRPLTLQPSGMALVPTGRCDLLEQTFLHCDSLLAPPPTPALAACMLTVSKTQTPPARLVLVLPFGPPTDISPQGDSLKGPCSASLMIGTINHLSNPPLYIHDGFLSKHKVTAGKKVERKRGRLYLWV